MTYREALNKLPDGYRELAFSNANSHNLVDLSEECESIDFAIFSCFGWANTPEGIDFWYYVNRSYEHGTPLPPLTPKKQTPQEFLATKGITGQQAETIAQWILEYNNQ